MDCAKTGRFIAALRMDKSFSQRKMADILGVTDKAASRWETGKGFPDVTLLRPIGDLLGVTINELLAGECIAPEDLGTKADENIESTLRFAVERRKAAITRLLLIAGIALLVFSLLLLGIDSSWIAFYSILGAVILSTAILRVCKKRRLLYAFLTMVLCLAMFEVRDYVNVRYYQLPPVYVLSTVTSFTGDNGTVRYHKLFYDICADQHNGQIANYRFTGHRS